MLAAIKAEKQRRATEAERQRLETDAATIRARCRTLAGFVREAWRVLEPVAGYVHSWHIDAICAHLEAVTDGRINRLLINVPPGSMKSLLVSVLWPAWEWGPRGMRTLRYIATSFNEGPVKRDTRKCRDLILSDWYQALWPEVALTRTAELSFANSSTGSREGVAFGSLTSQRGDRLIIDDPHSTETAESDTERQNTTRRFREGATNRLNDQDRSAIVVIMQRLHPDDISGVIQKLGMDYVHLMIPMEFEPGRSKSTAIGWSDPRTADGDLLDPVRFGRSIIDKLKRDMGSFAYAGQYQQRPTPREGGLFKRAWFGEPIDVVPRTTRRVRAWDLAGTVKKTGNRPDWTAGIRLAWHDGTFYVEHVVRLQDTPGVVENTIKATAGTDGVAVSVRLPQDPGQAGKAQAETLIRLLAGYTVKAVPVTGDKETRARPAAAQAEAGNIKLVRGDWNEAFMDELCNFPAGSHDDMVDAFADALNELALGSTYDASMAWAS